MKRLPLATLLGVLCFTLLATFTQHRAAADHTQSSQQTDQVRSNKTIVNDDGTITTVSDESDKAEFVPGEMLVKFRNEKVPNPKGNFSLKTTAYDVVGKTATHTISVSSK